MNSPPIFIDPNLPPDRIDFIAPRRTLPDGTLESEQEWGKRCVVIFNIGKASGPHAAAGNHKVEDEFGCLAHSVKDCLRCKE